MRIVLMGPPGSGKGTQADRLAERVGVTRMSTGDLFRSHQERGTELGRLAEGYMKVGEYVPDDVTVRMVMEWIVAPEQAEGFVLDGFPRTIGQAEALDREAEGIGGIDRVIYMEVPRGELVARLTGRQVCRGCQSPYHVGFAPPAVRDVCDRCGGELYQRDDDKIGVVERRLGVYDQETGPVIDHYRRAGKLIGVDGTGTADDVERALSAATATGPD